MAKRGWSIPVDSDRPEHWTPDGEEPVALIDPENEQACLEEAMNMIFVLKRFGGTVGLIAVRDELAPGIFETKRIAIAWESYAPARRLPKAQQQKADPPAEPPLPEPPLPDELTDEEIADHFPEEEEDRIDATGIPEPRPEALAGMFDASVAETSG
jgi:hypothetical protein